jgi:ABC-type spermidine/putrescine transport system permease subunit II
LDLACPSVAPEGEGGYLSLTMRKAAAAFGTLNAGFWTLSILLGLVMLIVPFLQIDRNFNINPSLSLAGVVATWDASLLSALWNSVSLSVIASLFAIACGGLLNRFIERRPLWLWGLMIAVYSVNPVARALSYFDLFQLYTPIDDIAAMLVGQKFATSILLPSLILAMHYLPIYLMRNLFILKKENRAHDLPPLLETLFDDIPVWVRGFPISFALFFLLTFFDYWVIQVISGNTVLYWTPLFVQRGFQARAVSEAALMIVIGLVATLAAYVAALLLSVTIRTLWKRLRPLMFAGLRVRSKTLAMISTFCAWIALIFCSWPLWGTVIRLITTLTGDDEFRLVLDTDRGIFVMLVLGIVTGVVSATLGLMLSAAFQERPRANRWWLPALYFLALVPEAAYVLFSLFVTGAGILHGNPFWLFFLMTSFSVPMSFFLWESLWGPVEQQKLWMIGNAMSRQPIKAVQLAMKEWGTAWATVFAVIFWLTIDNVFITDFAAGPTWKTLSAVIFNSTKRGFSTEEFYSSVLGTVSVLVVIGVTLALSKTKRQVS